MHTQRGLLLGAAVLGVVSAFLPWVSTPLRSFSGMDVPGSDAVLLCVLCGTTLACSLPGERRAPLTTGARVFVVLLGAAIAGVALLDLASVRERTADTPMVSVGVGLYLMAAAGAGLVVLALAFPRQTLPPPPVQARCPRCGAPVELVPAYGRWWCRACGQYT